jgi:hypothetical protein
MRRWLSVSAEVESEGYEGGRGITDSKAILLLILGACSVRELSYLVHCFGLLFLVLNLRGGSGGLAF